jgi:hypothetical protein
MTRLASVYQPSTRTGRSAPCVVGKLFGDEGEGDAAPTFVLVGREPPGTGGPPSVGIERLRR